jgi:hypothetical protein
VEVMIEGKRHVDIELIHDEAAISARISAALAFVLDCS